MSLYVWGTGCAAGELIERGFEPARITAFVESVPESRSFLGRKVIAYNRQHPLYKRGNGALPFSWHSRGKAVLS